MNEINEQELAALLDEHAELQENMNNGERDNINEIKIKQETMNIAQEERMTSEEILREIDEQESLDMEN